VEYFQIHIFVSAPERLTGKLSKILSFPQMGHKHVIEGFRLKTKTKQWARAVQNEVGMNYKFDRTLQKEGK